MAGFYPIDGPTVYLRASGAPVVEITAINAPKQDDSYLLRIHNGGLEDDEYDRVSSSVILLNGNPIFAPNEFNQNVAYLEKYVSLDLVNELSVEVRGKPGGALVLMIDGDDTTPPTISASVTPVANAAGWHRQDATVSFVCEDDASGISDCPAPQIVNTEAANQIITGSATDIAGNSTTTSVSISIDKTAPSLATTTSPLPNVNGWHNTEVAVITDCQDSGSGIEICSSPVMISTEGAAQLVSSHATDVAGNSATTTTTVNIDSTPPAISATLAPVPNSAGWNNTNVTVSFNCSDESSGVEHCPDPIILNTEGANQVVSGTVVDLAGNTATTSVSINLDKSLPTLSANVAPTADTNNWHTSDVTVSFECNDLISGITDCPEPVIVSNEGTNQIVSGSATDIAGNSVTVFATVNLDKSGPSVTTVISPEANINGWHNSDVTVSYTCEDLGSGVSSCPDSQVLSSEGAGQLVSGTASDIAGNTTVASVSVDIDKTVPTISVTPTPSANASGWNNSDVLVTFTCSDLGSGISECPTPTTLTSEGVDQVVSGSVSDLAGNQAATTLTLKIDKTAPLIQILSPANGALVNGSAVTISGSVTDVNALTSFLIDGVSVSPDEGGHFEYTVSLVSGDNAFQIQATDIAGNLNTHLLSLTAIQESPPTISSAPIEESVEHNPYIYQVEATDPDTSDVLTYSLLRGAVGMSINSETGEINWTPTSDYLPSVAVDNNLCVVKELPDIGSFSPVRKWYSQLPGASTGTPIVAPIIDTNQDGKYDQLDNPSILYVTYSGNIDTVHGQLRVVRGDNGSEHWSSDLQTSATTIPAVGDIDGDLIPDVVMYLHEGGVAALNNDGTVKWTSAYPARVHEYNYSAINLADIDGDGQVEILARDHVLNGDGSLRLTLPAGGVGTTLYGADINQDGIQEIVQGERVFTATGEDFWDNTDKTGAYSAYANFDNDVYAEIVSVSRTQIRMIDHDGSVIWSIPFVGGGGGAPTIGDMTGDGLPNIGVAGRHYYLALNLDGRVLWKNSIDENSSQATSSTLFDFDGDGKVEVLYSDRYFIRAYDGETGFELFSIAQTSPTTKEYPVVADIDNDGHAEFIYNGSGLSVYEDANDSWMPTRSIWNQYDYNIFNVNDDATIPPQPKSGLLNHNSFRLNAYPDQFSRGLVDLRLSHLRMVNDGELVSLHVTATNRGLADMRAPTTVHFYSGDPDLAGQLLGSVSLTNLNTGGSVEVSLNGVSLTSLTDDLYAVVDEVEGNTECGIDNNKTRSALVSIRVTDTTDKFDEQLFAISVEDTNEAPSILTESLAEATVRTPYDVYLEATDPDIGDALEFSLINAPVGVSLDSISGRLKWTPFTTQAGAHEISVRVTDLQGLPQDKNYSINVIDPLVLDDHGVCGVIEHDSAYMGSNGAFTKDGSEYFFVTNINNKRTVQVYNVNLGYITHTIAMPESSRMTVPALSPDGEHLYVPRVDSQNGDRYVEAISTSTYEIVRSYRGGSFGWRYIHKAVVSPDGNYLYLSDYSFIVTLDLRSGVFGSISFDPEKQGQDDYAGIDLSNDGKVLYVVGRTAGRVFALDPSTRKKITSIAHGVGTRWSGSTTDFTLSHDGKRGYVSHTSSPNIAVIDTDPDSPTYHQKIATLYSDGLATRFLQVSNDDRYIYVTTTDPGKVLVYGTDPDTPSSHHVLANTIDISGGGSHGARVHFHNSDDGYVGIDSKLKVICQKDDISATAPFVSSTPVTHTRVGEAPAYLYDVEVTDPDVNDLHFFILSRGPDGMAMDEYTGEITWVPSNAQVGSHSVTARVYDNAGLYYVHSFNVQVAPPNESPVITSTPVDTATHGLAYRYDVTATDVNNDVLLYQLTTAPGGMSIDSATGIISWTPASNHVGANNVDISVDDGQGGITTQSFVINVAANTPPSIISVPANGGKNGYVYRYEMVVTNPEPEVLQYNLISAPAGMSIDGNGVISWTPTADDIGLHTVTARVSDAVQYQAQTWSLTIIDNVLPLGANVVLNPTSVEPGESVTITVNAINAAGNFTRSLTVDGVVVALDSQGQAVYSSTVIGRHEVVATVSDLSGEATDSAALYVKDPTDVTPPVVNIETPTTNTEVTTLIDIVGTVQETHLDSYRLLYAPTGSSDYTTIAEGAIERASETLGTLDPSLMINGLYDVILEATDLNGQTASDSIQVKVTGDLKVGNFSFTTVDLEIPVSGIPIRVTRTYDSRQRSQALDFGYGWRIGYQDVKLEESRIPGQGWALNEYPSGPLGLLTTYCVEPLGQPTVVITLPNGDVESFDVHAAQPCWEGIVVLDHTLAFTAQSDTHSTLELQSPATVRLNGDHLEILGDFAPYNPDLYRLTTKEGYLYHLDQDFGVTSIIDPNGNTLTYTEHGILHSDGKSVLFNRDGLGRITAITDPMNQVVMAYAYDTAGDLVSAKDAASLAADGNGVQYTYNNTHGLVDIIDPLGRNIVKNIYDDSGRLIAQEDSDGNRTDFNHDIDGRLSVVTDRLGNATQYYYDERGNVTTQIDALGNTTTYTHDARGNQLSQTDALGNTSTATYNAANDQLTQTDALGNTVEFSYNSRGQELTVQDARGNVFTNTYDSVGNLLSIKDPLDNLAGQNIDANGNVSKRIDAAGNETSFTYDSEGNVLTETDPLGNTVSNTYDANGNVLTETRTRLVDGLPVEETTTYVYDAQNRLIQITDPLGHVTQTEYDASGNESARIDALGNRTEFVYDAYRRLLQTTYPDLTTEINNYDAEGNLISSTDRAGRTTTYTYDALNRQTDVTYADGSSTSTEYDALGRVIAEIDANNNRTEYGYDDAGRRTSVTDALGNITTFSYDADGNLLSQRDANNHTVSYAYDALDRRTQTTYHDSSVMTEAYDPLGRVISQTDQGGKITQYEYDALGRLTAVIETLNSVEQRTEYSYDEAGNKLSQRDANGNTTRWSYDALGRVLSRTLPLGQTENFVYDANGNQVSHTDFNGNTITFEYDVNNRLVRKVYADSSDESYGYDAIGNRTSATDAGGTTSYQYDSRDRLTQETHPNGNVIDYSYDAQGNRTALKTTVGTTVETTQYGFDALNRLDTVTDPTAQTTTYVYDNVGNRASVSYPNGNTTDYTYDSLNRLTHQETQNAANTVIASYDYTLASTGHRTQVIDHTGATTSYSYDDLYRLIGEDLTNHPVLGAQSNSYEYDAVGNRTYSIENGVHTEYTYDANDRLTQAGGESYTYDANGNILSVSIDNTQSNYSYDYNNRLIGMLKTESGLEVDNVSYAYDLDGLRIAKNDDGVVTNYLVDKNRDYGQVIKELDSANTTQVDYLYGDDLIKQTRAANDGYYLYDGHGSTRALADGTGNITDTYDYNAYGSLIDSTGTTDNSYLYTGEQFDQSLSNYYLRARYYDPNHGRFTTMDTWMGVNSDPVTLHKYAYGNVDPVNHIDPSGNFSLGSLSAGMSIQGVLTTINIASSAYDFFLVASGEQEITAKAVGQAVLLTLLPGSSGMKLFSSLSKKCKNSFEEGTLVHTEIGLRRIEEIEIGDKVWAFDESSQQLVLEEVVHLIQGEKEYDLVSLSVSNENILSTLEHPFYVDGQWRPANELKIGDLLQILSGDKKGINDVQFRHKTSRVYNLTINNIHNYHVGEAGFLVHNTNVECFKLPRFKTKGKKNPSHPHISENAPDWGKKGPHIKIGSIELLIDAGPAGDFRFEALGKVNKKAYEKAVREAKKALKDKGFRVRLYNAAAKGYETAINEAKNLNQGKVKEIENVIAALLRGL